VSGSLSVGLLVSLALGADGVEGQEVTGRGYARQPVGKMVRGADGKLSNVDEVRFPEALEDWGRVVAIGLFDGDELFRARTIARVLDMYAGDDVVFAPGMLKLADGESCASPRASRVLG
jgi:hypothetical protein